ncbi:MAG: hypothetical protein A2Y40_02055 [Candidatus Margulisbacteria bacterium GWF2_35_9]|nr:MAG: hypothetical protein A2Y40_02055 [Candidatus Margulisbacteria bacterium GWF2_35_9]
MSGSISGISSGMDTESIINGLMSIKRQRVDNLTAQKELEQAKEDSWASLASNLVTLQLSAYNLSKTSTYDVKTATISDESVLAVTASLSATPGSYSFYVDQLATTHQLSSNGFNDYNSTPVGAGSISIEMGNGDIEKKTDLNFLNGGDGVGRGYIKITDRDNNYAVIDLTHAMNVEDVINAINNTSGINITASIGSNGDGIDISYNGSGINNLKIEEVSGGSTAEDLGIKQSVSANSINGRNIHYLTTNSSLNNLNDGLGISKQSFNINGTTIDVTSANTLADVIAAINAESATTNVSATLSSNGKSITLTEDVPGAFVITENGYSTAKDLGILNVTNTGAGDDLIASIDSVMLKNLTGAHADQAGIRGTSFVIEGTTIDITGAVSLSDIMNAINNETGTTAVSARYNSSKNGLELYSSTKATFSVTENGSTTAEDLGILGTSSNYSLKGSDLDFKYMSENTLLEDMNLGDGVRQGVITFSATDGDSFSLSLKSTSIKTVGDVISQINLAGSSFGISASINSTGDGIRISDSNAGSENLVVSEYGSGHMAKDLGILGSTSSSSIDGSFEKNITITATDTLEDIQSAINSLGIDVKASVINDGSTNPYRLILTSGNSGETGRIIFSSDISSLSMDTAVEAKDAVLIMGNPTSGSAVFTSSSSNTVSNFITGLTLELKNTSTSAITVGIFNDTDGIIESAKDFVDKFNGSMSIFSQHLSYDSDTGEGGVLFGDSSLMMIQQQLYSMITKSVSSLSGDITSLSQIGISMGLDGSLSINETTMKSVLQSNLDGVKELMTYVLNSSSTATVLASSTDPGWSASGAVDGNTQLSNFASGSTGWQADNGSSYELDFGTAKEFTSFSVYGVDTNTDDVLSSFVLQYWDSKTDDWVDYRSITGNTGKNITVYFPYGLSTEKIRLNDIQGTGAKAKILDIQANQTIGMAGAMDLALSKITNGGTGAVSSSLDGIASNMGVLDEQISNLEDRMTMEEERLRKQFTQMESLLGELKNMSSYMTSQTSSLNNNWNYK